MYHALLEEEGANDAQIGFLESPSITDEIYNIVFSVMILNRFDLNKKFTPDFITQHINSERVDQESFKSGMYYLLRAKEYDRFEEYQNHELADNHVYLWLFQKASEEGKIEALNYLLDLDRLSYDSPNENTPLHIIADNNNHEIIKRVLELQKDNINAQNNLGYTPYARACAVENKELISLLLQQPGLISNTKDINGKFPHEYIPENTPLYSLAKIHFDSSQVKNDLLDLVEDCSESRVAQF
ncbi:MAG: ankyrin repeat domain-containing protein [Simkaniaceae bacterium]